MHHPSAADPTSSSPLGLPRRRRSIRREWDSNPSLEGFRGSRESVGIEISEGNPIHEVTEGREQLPQTATVWQPPKLNQLAESLKHAACRIGVK